MAKDEGTYVLGFNLTQLAAHNKYRALHGVPAMTIDTDLAIEA